MSSTPRNAMGSRQTVSSELTPREFHPSDGLPEPPSLSATVLSRSDLRLDGSTIILFVGYCEIGSNPIFSVGNE